MTAVGAWTIALSLGYTVFLVGAGRLARRRAAAEGEFFVGGRRFRPITVALCITGLFGGSSFIAILELSYRTGVSAIWYGVAETVQVLLIAFLLVVPFRERMLVTISGLIGDRFGRVARGLAGGITAFTFPMWSVATAIAFASALHAFTGLSIQVSIIFTALLLLFYLSSGGMWSIAFTQTANCIVFVLMLGLGAAAFLIEPGWSGLVDLATIRPTMLDWGAVGMPLIIAWFGTFVVNVVLAQAALQMAMSCRTPEDGRKGMLLATGMGVPFIVLGVIFGMAAAVVVPGQALGLVAVPLYIADVLPAPLVGVFFLGIWACALGWGGPCQFSGATSLGRDVGRALNPQATETDLVRYTRWSLIVLTALMIVFGLLRSEQSAWWNVLAWTLRNGATLAPVLAALFWPLATRRSAYAALTLGFLSGLGWYALGGWAAKDFHLGIHPVWVAMSINVIALVAATVIERSATWRITTDPRRSRIGVSALVSACALAVIATLEWSWLHPRGLSGLAGFAVLILLATTVVSLADGPPPADATPDLEPRRQGEHRHAAP